MQNPFNFFDDEIEKINVGSNAIIETHLVEAYQIIRIKTTISGKTYREIIDTINVNSENGESSRNRALTKAKNIGNCIVVEKSEIVIESF